jgi:hypothetical protein
MLNSNPYILGFILKIISAKFRQSETRISELTAIEDNSFS